MKKYPLEGFHLIELMVALTLISCLAIATLPLYAHFAIRAHREEAKIALAQLTLAIETYYFNHHSYIGATLANLQQPSDCAAHHYHLAILKATRFDYLLAAIPYKQQAKDDPECGSLTIDAMGVKRVSGTGKRETCW